MKRNAFTVLEVIIVIVIVAILAAIAVPNFLQSRPRAIEAQRRASISKTAALQSASAQTLTREAQTPFKYNPTNGTISSGDVWRVRNGNPAAPPVWVTPQTMDQYNTERYSRIDDNPFHLVGNAPLSTFSIDVDTAAYSNVRRFLNEGRLPPEDAVRIEELINYFTYEYPAPAGNDAFATSVEIGDCPWEPDHRLVRIGLRGRNIPIADRPESNLVFLIDVSGSMSPDNKLPLLKRSLALLVDQLTEKDRVAIVVYAGKSGLVLPSTSGSQKALISQALERLEAGGSTNGGAGIQLAYKLAIENFRPGGTNRVILCTDGDFNVGSTGEGDLTRLVEEQAKSGVYLSILGFGMGNYNDSMMEKVTNRGNGNYAYIDSLNEARKVLVEQLSGTLLTVAKDVKIQVEFNPRKAAAYRLVGYENRLLANEDFNDDKKDAGEIGANHMVTALYEIVPPGAALDLPAVDALKYQTNPSTAGDSDELLTVKLRYKEPDATTSKLIEVPVIDDGIALKNCSDDFIFASCVAGFGMKLRHPKESTGLPLEDIASLAELSRGTDQQGRRAEFVELVRKFQRIKSSHDGG